MESIAEVAEADDETFHELMRRELVSAMRDRYKFSYDTNLYFDTAIVWVINLAKEYTRSIFYGTSQDDLVMFLESKGFDFEGFKFVADALLQHLFDWDVIDLQTES